MRNALLFILLCAAVTAAVTRYTGRREFIAREHDLRNYRSWRVIDYTIGQTNPLLGGAHRGTDERFSRRIYISPNARREGSEFSIGTIIVKETFTWENGREKFSPTDGLIAMVKRDRAVDPAGDALALIEPPRRFNASGNGWEWIFLAPDGNQILNRGGGNMGMCNTCHRYAVVQDGGGDLVFAYPSEFEYDGGGFSSYLFWNRIGQLIGPDPYTREVEGVTDSATTRRVYKKQFYANPDTDSLGYPVGTIFLKEVLREGLPVTLLAQVKRGGGFNPGHGGWEWFTVEPASFAIRARGDSLAGNACNHCHAAACEQGKGRDYVFRHPDDPFNR